jgi:hypothetical protein
MAKGTTMSAGPEERDANGSFDTSGRDRVSLSAHERQTLANLEARIRLDDPSFAARMRGRSWRWMRHVAAEVRVPELPGWAGPVLFVAGLVATVLVLSVLPWLSILTLGVAVIGAHRLAKTVRSRLERVRAQRGHDRHQ